MSDDFGFTLFGLHIGATALSIAGGVVAWLVQHWRDNRRERVQKTVEMLMPFTTSERLAEANVVMAKLIGAGEAPVLGADPEVDRRIIDLLDYYEFLCELLARGVLDRPTVLSLRGRLLGKIFLHCRDYIEALRRRHGRGVYVAIEDVVRRYGLA